MQTSKILKLTNYYVDSGAFDAVRWSGIGQKLEGPFAELEIVKYPDPYGPQSICLACGCSMNTHGKAIGLNMEICPGSYILKDEKGEFYIYSKTLALDLFARILKG